MGKKKSNGSAEPQPVAVNGRNGKTTATSPVNTAGFSNYGSTATSNGSPSSTASASGSLLSQVKSAHDSRDAVASRELHQLKLSMAQHGHAQENHLSGGGYIKSAVYGGLDGIITTFATVTSVAGSGLPHSVILIIGIAHLVADGLSMGLGDMLSSQAEADLVNHERAREVWEFENYPEGEMDEMIELYEKKGIATDDAKLVVHTLAKYKEAFIDIMMVEELNLMPVDDDDSPLTGGVVTFVSFMLFGVIPLVPYLVNLIPGIGMSADATLYASCVLTVVTLFLLGAVKANYVGQQWWKSGTSMMVNGSVAAFCGWLIGFLLKLTGIQDVA
jgi:VIT1/CCC1 family predicted Fe2+/Mn2+ transporter